MTSQWRKEASEQAESMDGANRAESTGQWTVASGTTIKYDHLKRIRKNVKGVTSIKSTRKYLDAVLELLRPEGAGAKDVPAPSVPGHKEQLVTRDFVGPAEIAVYWQCVAGLLRYTQDRADAQFEMSILGSMFGKPTAGPVIALIRVARYLKGLEPGRGQARSEVGRLL